MAIYLPKFQRKNKKRFRQINGTLDDLQLQVVFEGVSASLQTSSLYRTRTFTMICSISSVPRSRGVTEVQRERPASLSTVTRTEVCPLLFLTTTSDKRRTLLWALPRFYILFGWLPFPPPPSFTRTTLKKQCDDNPTEPVPPKPRGICVFDGWNPMTSIASLLHPSPLLKFFALENKIWLGLRKG